MKAGRIRSSIEAPRWAKLPTFLRELAWRLDCEIEVQSEKGWIRETVMFEVRGTEEKLVAFKQNLEKATAEYNATQAR